MIGNRYKQYNEQYSAALEKFREVNELNPGHPYVKKNISDSRTAISEGRDGSAPTLGIRSPPVSEACLL